MITITVNAKTENAFKGLINHFNDCNKLRNRLKLKSHGVTQKLFKNSLEICYSNLLIKIQNKLKHEFKEILKEEQKNDFIKQVDNFMQKQKVNKKEYEVIFNDTNK